MKNSLLLTAVMLMAANAQANLTEWEAAISGANPLHWYKFDEAGGADCLDSGSGALNGTYDGVSLSEDGYLGAGTAAGFDRSGANRANFAGAADLAGVWTVEYIVKTTKPPAGSDSQVLHDGDSTSIRLAGWTAIGEAGFTQYGVADYRFTPTIGLTLDDLIVQQDEWMHLVWRNDGSGTQLFFNGKMVGTSTSTIALPRLRIGGRGAGPADMLMGVLDEAVVFNRVLTNADIIAHATAASLVDESLFRAANPSPPDGAEGVMSPLFQWTAGATAKWHDIYFGTNPTPGAAEYKGQQPLAWNMYYHMEPMIPGATYYWRIDQVEADGATIYAGDIWSFTAAPLTAHNPDPPDGAKYVDPDANLNWTAGATADSHDVYFGTDETEVTDGTGGTSKGNQSGASYEPGTLAKGTRYYWRIDEVEADGTTKHTGDVWSFTTLPDITITDPDLVGWWKLDEGFGTTVFDWSGHGHDGTLANGPQWVSGYDGDALEFDGRDDYVNLGTPSQLYLPENYTYTAWFKVGSDIDGDSGPQYLLCIGSRSDLVFGVEDGVGTDGDLSLHYYDTVPGFHAVSVGQTVWSSDDWHMVAGTKDAAVGHKIYLDGELKNSDFNTNNDNYATSRMISIGARAWTGHQFFEGTIDDVRIYTRALTLEEIKQVMRIDPLLAWNPSPTNVSTPDIEHTAPLTWSPGSKAAKHDVYFGTDRDAVEDADTTATGIYRGRQDPNTYTAPEGVEFGQAYYWRIDEYNTDATISTGRIWSFTVAEYLSVDDFDSYDDYCNRIFYTWPDGWGHNGDAACGVPPYGGNGTGSTVGYLSEPYAEQTITHDGSFQSMPMEYLNDSSSGKALYSETERTFDPPQDWTRRGVKALTLWFRGLPGTMSSFTGSDPYTMTAAGGDIWGAADHFHFVWKSFSGEGSIVVRVDSLEGENPYVWAKAGVMIRETLDANSVQAMVIVTPSTSNRVQFAWRNVTGGISYDTSTAVDTITLPHWVKLSRQANIFTAQHSTDGVNWENIGDPTFADIVMGSNVFIGLALTSQRDAARIPITAVFSNVSIAGSVSGQWASEDIGLSYNSAEPLYVVVEDSAGQSKVVNHTDDPNAVLSNTWQEWNIDLTQVGDAGVNLQSIKKIYIGVGNRTAPTLGGGGMLYVDDIRLYQPRCVPSLLKPDADFNDNCMVDYLDLEIMANEWLVDANDLEADLDLDEDVDFKDYAGLASTWLDMLMWP